MFAALRRPDVSEACLCKGPAALWSPCPGDPVRCHLAAMALLVPPGRLLAHPDPGSKAPTDFRSQIFAEAPPAGDSIHTGGGHRPDRGPRKNETRFRGGPLTPSGDAGPAAGCRAGCPDWRWLRWSRRPQAPVVALLARVSAQWPRWPAWRGCPGHGWSDPPASGPCWPTRPGLPHDCGCSCLKPGLRHGCGRPCRCRYATHPATSWPATCCCPWPRWMRWPYLPWWLSRQGLQRGSLQAWRHCRWPLRPQHPCPSWWSCRYPFQCLFRRRYLSRCLYQYLFPSRFQCPYQCPFPYPVS